MTNLNEKSGKVLLERRWWAPGASRGKKKDKEIKEKRRRMRMIRSLTFM